MDEESCTNILLLWHQMQRWWQNFVFTSSINLLPLIVNCVCGLKRGHAGETPRRVPMSQPPGTRWFSITCRNSTQVVVGIGVSTAGLTLPQTRGVDARPTLWNPQDHRSSPFFQILSPMSPRISQCTSAHGVCWRIMKWTCRKVKQWWTLYCKWFCKQTP